jgi:CheY-like chemotaxis protein
MSDAKTRILIVDDELVIRKSLSLLLGEIGYSVSTAEDGFSALTSLRKDVPDFLICDLFMPGMSGFELSSVVRRRFPHLRTIVMSGAFQGNEVPSGVAGDAFFQKGSSVGCLLRILDSLSTEDGKTPGRASGGAVPVWVQPSGYDRPGDAQFAICCPECLRVFFAATLASPEGMRETKCVHCCSRVHYSIVPAMDRVHVPVSHGIRNREMPMPAEAPQFEN